METLFIILLQQALSSQREQFLPYVKVLRFHTDCFHVNTADLGIVLSLRSL
jgi:hypothetical protein